MRKLFRDIRTFCWALKELSVASRIELWTLVGVSVFLGCLPAASLLTLAQALRGFLDWDGIGAPLLFVAVWSAIFLIEKVSSPLLSALRVHLNEKSLVHFNTVLIRRANEIDGLSPFETKEIKDEMHFLQVESARRPMNFVYILSDVMRDIVVITTLSLCLSTVSWGLGLVILLVSIPHALAVMSFERLRWTDTLFNSPESRMLRWVSRVAVDGERAKEVRIFGFGEFLARKYLKIAGDFIQRFSKRCWGEMFPALACTFATVLGYASVLSWVVWRAVSHSLGVTEFVVIFQGFHLMHGQIAGFLQSLAMAIPALDYFRRFESFRRRQDLLMPRVCSPKNMPLAPAQLELKGVSFVYPSGHVALRAVDMVIRPGEKLAIVGENGAGKSTLVKLLLRFYDPTSGSITYDGVDIREYDLQEWRNLFSAVFQDFGKYHLSLRENVELGNGGEPLALHELNSVLDRSFTRKFSQKLPEAEDTPLGAEFGGPTLSGGEWQRVAMARALVKPAQILVLDEPTASLDPKVEAEVFRAFAEASRDTTTLFITHRLGSVAMADRVILIKDGVPIEQGAHAELMKTGGEYATFYGLQAGQYIS